MNDNFNFDDDFFDLDAYEDPDIDEDDWDDYEECLPEYVDFSPKKRLIEGMTLESAEFADRTFANFQIGHFMFYNVTFKNCTFEQIDCQCGKFIACKFENCNIISFSGEGYGFIDCEFVRCKWSGNECIDDCFYYSNCKYIDCEENYDQ